MIGWIIEVVYHRYKFNKFVNRGFLYGPFSPIYGFGAIIIILLLRPYEHSVVALFIGGVVVASFLEYITGSLLEKLFDTRWWDYSDEKFNIKGYVSLKFSLVWGLVSVVFLKAVHPYVESFVKSMPLDLALLLYNALLILLVIDTTLTVASLLEFRKLVRELVPIRETLSEIKQEGENILRQKAINIYTRMQKRHISFLKAYPYITSGKLAKLIEEIEERKNNKK